MVLRVLLAGIALGAAGVSAPLAAPERSAGGTPVAFVSAEGEAALVAVDLARRRVIARTSVPAGPHNVAAYHDTGRRRDFVLVTSPPAGAVTLVDAFSQRVVKVWRGLGSPHDVEVEGRHAYVTDEERGELVVLDLRTRRLVARVRVPPGPHDVAIGDVALVTHGGRQFVLTLVDVSRPRRPKVLIFLAAGGAPHDISEQSDSASAFLTYWGSGAVGAVDWGRGRVLWKRTIGTLVHHVAFDYYHGRRLWATDHETGHVLLLASTDGRVLRRLEGCPGAHHVALGGTAWVAVACQEADALAVWDTRRWERTLVPVGDRPHGVAVAVLPR